MSTDRERVVIAMGVLLIVACRRPESNEASVAASASTALRPPPVVRAAASVGLPVAASAAPSVAPALSAAPLGEAYAVVPTAQFKSMVNGLTKPPVHAEPGVLVGPKKQLVKAFDCQSKGAPRESITRVCVSFASCAAREPTTPDVLAEIACQGPSLSLQLVRDDTGLVFRVAPSDHPLAKRPMSHIALPAETYPQLLPFKKQYVTAYVDL